jgi:hypothetical protein
VPEQPTHQQPTHHHSMPQQPMPQQPMPQQPVGKSSKKGVIIAIVVGVAVFALFVSIIVFAIRLIMNNDENDTRDTEAYIEVDNGENGHDNVGVDALLLSPFNLDVWGTTQVVEIEVDNITLEVPLPPNTIMEEVDMEGSRVWIDQGTGDDYFRVGVLLGDEIEDDFSEYSDAEVNRTLYWYMDYGVVVDYSVYNERNATLLITHWEDDYGEGITFTKIREYQGILLLAEVSFESRENREDFFEAYGFNDHFESIIEDVYVDWTQAREDMNNQEEEEEEEEEDNRNGEEVWTQAQRESWYDLTGEFVEVSNPSFDLYFYIWDIVILDETVHDDYPDADVDRLVELHTEFDERFLEMLGIYIEVDFTLPYDSEFNQNAFQEKRELISEHERFYEEFSAALEGR